jgi:hypothetical protein
MQHPDTAANAERPGWAKSASEQAKSETAANIRNRRSSTRNEGVPGSSPGVGFYAAEQEFPVALISGDSKRVVFFCKGSYKS